MFMPLPGLTTTATVEHSTAKKHDRSTNRHACANAERHAIEIRKKS
jgi:hypothetical protein